MAKLFALEGWVIGVIVAVVALVLIIIIAGVYISMKNGLIRTVNQTDESWSTIDVYLKKRYDLIPNLVETVKGYAKHESETLQRVISARNAAAGASSPDERIEADRKLTGELKTLLNFTVERYPDLKADRNFTQLMSELKAIESELANARKYYNANVKEYNNKIMVFPSSFVAGRMHLKKRAYFELDSEEERRNVKVEF